MVDFLSVSTIGAIWLTVKLASVTTVCLLLVGIPLAWWLARTRCRLKEIIAATVAIPLVLPPTVLGFYMLAAMGPGGPLGWLASALGLATFAFRFEGLVIGSVVYSLPFAVQPIRNAFETMGERPMEVAATLRRSPLAAFCSVALPLARPGILTGAILGFAHTMGEYGVVMMIGGNTPQTSVVSTTIVQLNENQQYAEAYMLSFLMVAFAFFIILAVMMVEKHKKRKIMS